MDVTPRGEVTLMISWLAAAAFGLSRLITGLFFAEGIDWK
jgi:hypothetical protein